MLLNAVQQSLLSQPEATSSHTSFCLGLFHFPHGIHPILSHLNKRVETPDPPTATVLIQGATIAPLGQHRGLSTSHLASNRHCSHVVSTHTATMFLLTMSLLASKPPTRKGQRPPKGPKVTFPAGSPLQSPAYTLSTTPASRLLLNRNRYTVAPGPLNLLCSVLNSPPTYISMDNFFISFRSSFQKGFL